jgi:predicted GIY-YIG superfamily endonuclease
MLSSCAYILASKRNGTVYIGVTSNLVQRVWKLELIERDNPEWNDLYPGVAGAEPTTGSRLSPGCR